jgi:hypothetical protein
VGGLRHRLLRLEHDVVARGSEQAAVPMSDEERNRRIRALIDLQEERGWPADDWRVPRILAVLVRAADRAAQEQPNDETRAQVAAHWRERLERCTAAEQ